MSAVDTIYNEHKGIDQYLTKNQQPSLSSDLTRHFTKTLILSSASHYEQEVQRLLICFAEQVSNNNSLIVSFLKKKAINLLYHTYFDWGKKDDPEKPGQNANHFLSLFGEDFKTACSNEIGKDQKLDQGVKAFIEIGHLRNYLVHSNFAAIVLDNKTAEDIYNLHQSAEVFITYLKTKLLSSPPAPGSGEVSTPSNEVVSSKEEGNLPLILFTKCKQMLSKAMSRCLSLTRWLNNWRLYVQTKV